MRPGCQATGTPSVTEHLDSCGGVSCIVVVRVPNLELIQLCRACLKVLWRCQSPHNSVPLARGGNAASSKRRPSARCLLWSARTYIFLSTRLRPHCRVLPVLVRNVECDPRNARAGSPQG